jgi:hypothetical protein
MLRSTAIVHLVWIGCFLGSAVVVEAFQSTVRLAMFVSPIASTTRSTTTTSLFAYVRKLFLS